MYSHGIRCSISILQSSIVDFHVFLFPDRRASPSSLQIVGMGDSQRFELVHQGRQENLVVGHLMSQSHMMNEPLFERPVVPDQGFFASSEVLSLVEIHTLKSCCQKAL
jgi:hypothetical protein